MTHDIFVELEPGDISTASGTGYVTNTLNVASTRFRTAFPIEVSADTFISLKIQNDSESISQITVIEYDDEFTFTKATTVTENTLFKVAATTKYIKCVVIFGATGYNPKGVSVKSSTSVRIVKNPKIRSVSERFVFQMPEDGVYGSAVLMLPPNYSVDGDGVPLLVYLHGSLGFANWDCEIGYFYDGDTYLPYIEYLRDEGYAILDVYGWSSKYLAIADTQDISSEPNKSNTFVTPITYSSFLRGIQYALSRYNLDEHQVSMYCKSLGGGLANTFAVRADIQLTAICELAPTIDVFYWGSWGQSVAARTIIADQLGLTGDVSGVFLKKNFDYRSTNGNTFMIANLDKISGFNPGWNYIGKTLSEKYQDSYDKDYTNTNYCREVLYPVKIWVAPDDTNISYPKILEFVAQCRNNSKDVTLREMPENTGGHHSVDYDPNAPKSSGTTALGITYTDIPTAYVEMVEFIRSRS